MQHIEIMGNVGRDPELRHNDKGNILSFSVAVNTRVLSDGEWSDHTEWFSVTTFNRTDYWSERLEKGTRVLVKGEFQLRKYSKKDGSGEGQSLDVRAFDITIISRSKSSQGSQDDGEQSDTKSARSASNGNTRPKSAGAKMLEESEPDTSDLPF